MVQGKGGLQCWGVESQCFCDLGAHATFQNPRNLVTGLEIVGGNQNVQSHCKTSDEVLEYAHKNGSYRAIVL
jgi:hypothetical protein